MFEIVIVSQVLSWWILLSICLIKISSERNYDLKTKVLAVLPIGNMFVITKIIGVKFWKFVLVLIGFAIAARIVEAIVVNSFGYTISETETIIYFITIIIAQIPLTWYVWSQVAKTGGHSNYDTLGILMGLPIISSLVIFYITWKGKW